MQYFFDFFRPTEDKEPNKGIPTKIVYRSEKGSPLTFTEVDAQTKYFVTKLDTIEKKLNKLLSQQRKEQLICLRLVVS